jgi:hypothetical protein
MLRGDLVHRDAGVDVRAGGLARVHTRQPRRATARVLADAFAGNRLARLVVEVREHHQAILEGRERRHDRRQPEAGALGRRRPRPHVPDAIGQIHHTQSARAFGRGARGRGESWNHAVEERQRKGDAHATQECSAGQVLLRNDHDCRPPQ